MTWTHSAVVILWDSCLCFAKKTAFLLAPKLAVTFIALLRKGSFPVCWRIANVILIPT